AGDFEIEQMAQPITAVAAAVANAVGPGIVVQRLFGIELYVAAAQADPILVNAGKVRFAADSRGKATIQRVIPDIHLPREWRVDGRNEVASSVNGVDDELIGADAVEAGHLVIGNLLALRLQSPAAMGEADHAPLRLAPFQNWQVPGGPLVDTRRAGVIVLSQAEQTEMPGMRAGEARDFDVVPHQGIGRGELAHASFEVLLLVIPARPPGQH